MSDSFRQAPDLLRHARTSGLRLVNVAASRRPEPVRVGHRSNESALRIGTGFFQRQAARPAGIWLHLRDPPCRSDVICDIRGHPAAIDPSRQHRPMSSPAFASPDAPSGTYDSACWCGDSFFMPPLRDGQGAASEPAGCGTLDQRQFLLFEVTASITRSRLKLPGFCRGGNSRKLCNHCPTYALAGAMMNICSTHQRP